MRISEENQPTAITLEDPYSPGAQYLIGRLVEELSELYGIEAVSSFHPADAQVPGSAFVIAWRGEQPVGCGALRPFCLEGGEVRRMFVERAFRRRGIARQILAKIEEAAKEIGYRSLCLETGLLQPEAMRLYESLSFERIPCYGKYAEDPLSVCFEKRLLSSRTQFVRRNS